MKRRFILYRRKLGGTFSVEDTQTRKQESLGTKDRLEAETLLNARNEANRQPMLNLQLAKAYLAGTDSACLLTPEGPCGFEPLHLRQASGFAGGR